ncbi:alpha-farnesene synthase-like [Olea europaea var. sylvestris]|uniref:alpha-farnesene synthase-like n=1 Tax=Olea europaea var. sylvestris TaxID=158386 RepID=UPI000C1D0F2E|nr:alpha-farnesene synthase-like [Olea europaea var. sylvestris]
MEKSGDQQQSLNGQMKIESVERRNANYKPNIWNYGLLQSLTNKYDDEKYSRQVETLKREVSCIFDEVNDPVAKLELIDCISKLALSHYFEKDIYETLTTMVNTNNIGSFMEENLYATALYFRILRQYGYEISQDVFHCFTDDVGEFKTSLHLDAKPILQLLEASYLGTESECLLDTAQVFATENLSANHEIFSLDCPLHLSVGWFNVKKHIHVLEKENKTRSMLLQLGRLNFNMAQAQQQKVLKEILRWWRDLDLLETLIFTRDRAVESFLWAVGIVSEPQHESLRKWLTIVLVFIMIIDGVYDIYGSIEELECFTRDVNRWNHTEIQQLPEAIRRCFFALYDTTNDMDLQIRHEKGWNSVLSYLKKGWADFCQALHVEAKWYHTGHTPRLWEYLDNGWISSSGPLLSLVVLFGVGEDITKTIEILENNQEIIYHSSLIIRLCNDQATSAAELERGDAPSSIQCYMREANVTEEEARDRIRNIITNSWKKINGLCINGFPNLLQTNVKYIINIARVANYIYQNGDGVSVQDGDTRDQVLSCLIEPFSLI